MTTTALLLVAFMLVAAVVDWFAVAARNRPVEYVAKPATMALLIGVALALEPASTGARAWFVAALTLGLAGDALLMLPDQRRFFIGGLAAFLVGHLAFVAGLFTAGVEGPGLLVGLAVVVVAVATVGRQVYRSVARERPELLGPVAAYIAVISLMVLAAFGTRSGLAIVGALSFYASDALVAFNRFGASRAWMPVTIMVTYHLGQLGLVLSLV